MQTLRRDEYIFHHMVSTSGAPVEDPSDLDAARRNRNKMITVVCHHDRHTGDTRYGAAVFHFSPTARTFNRRPSTHLAMWRYLECPVFLRVDREEIHHRLGDGKVTLYHIKRCLIKFIVANGFWTHDPDTPTQTRVVAKGEIRVARDLDEGYRVWVMTHEKSTTTTTKDDREIAVPHRTQHYEELVTNGRARSGKALRVPVAYDADPIPREVNTPFDFGPTVDEAISITARWIRRAERFAQQYPMLSLAVTNALASTVAVILVS